MNQKKQLLYLHVFCDSCFVSKYFLHFLHCYASTVFFTWIIIYIRLYMPCLWRQFTDEMLHQKTLAKNAWFFLVSVLRSQHFYKSQSFNWWPVCPVITHWNYTCLSPWALASLDQDLQQFWWPVELRLLVELYWEVSPCSLKIKLVSFSYNSFPF